MSESVATGDGVGAAPDLSAAAAAGDAGGLGPADEASLDDVLPEELDWGSIDDEDGAFGQFEAASVQLEEGELGPEGHCGAASSVGAASYGSAPLLPVCSSATGRLEDEDLDLGARTEACRGKTVGPSLLAAVGQDKGDRAAPDAVLRVSGAAPDPGSGSASPEIGAPCDPHHGDSAPAGNLQVDGPTLPGDTQGFGPLPTGFDGDASGSGAGRVITASAGATSTFVSTLARDKSKVKKGFSSDAGSAMETIHSLSASESRYAMADLTQLFMTANHEGTRAESQGRLLRVVLIYCRSSMKPQHQWPVKPKNFTLDIIYLHDKPSADNCPQMVYDALVDSLDHVSQYEGYILETGQGLARVLFRQMCILLSHPLQRCIQDDLDIPKQVAKKTLATEAAQNEDGTPVSSQQ